ncbi:MAG: alpha/beta hydrolase-fold protein [Bacteroidota bacterium]
MKSRSPKSFFILILLSTVITAQPRFSIIFPKERSTTPLDGRLLLIIAVDSTKEPRFQIDGDAGPKTQQIFGINVDGWKAGDSAIIDKDVFGYPLKSLMDVPRGEYWVQALLHKYEAFHPARPQAGWRADGHTVKLPMDRGEGQQWNRAPGNLLSKPKKMFIDPKENETITVVLDQEIPPIEPPKDTKYIKHVKMKSELLSKFWGRDMYLGVAVLLPYGFDEHPEAHYPLVINHGHFPATFGGWRETAPDTNLKPDYSERFRIHGYNRIQQEYAYKLYKDWTRPANGGAGANFPRFVIIEIQHANPYYDDSYAVNSANLGPYGDAITYELIPLIEKKFRCIGQGWARFLYGGSTGGWEALAAQAFYPDEYNGCWAACPDPIDFRAYTVVNIYENEDAYYMDSHWKKTPRPGKRNQLNEVTATLEETNYLELVLGDKGRSGGQWDIWQAVYSPVGDDGYPKPIWDKLTGKIDKKVAEYWRENYDLSYILRRDWTKLGQKLRGKIHLYAGELDNYYLNNAVHLTEEFLKGATNPPYDGEVDYECLAEHCWNGDHSNSIWISRLMYHQIHAPKILERIRKSAPAGADTTSWRY